MERSLEVMRQVAFQFDGDLKAKVFDIEIDAQSIVDDYKWMINQIEQLTEIVNLNTDEIIKLQNKYSKSKRVALNMFTENQKAFFEKALND